MSGKQEEPSPGNMSAATFPVSDMCCWFGTVGKKSEELP